MPLAAQDQVLGALAIGWLPGRAVAGAREVELANDFADQAALVLLVAAARATAQALQMSDERARIARDLHDHAIQGIFAVGLGLNGLASRLGGADADRMMELVQQLDDSISAIRRSIFALQPPTPATGPDVRSRLDHLVREQSTALGFAARLRVQGPLASATPSRLYDDLLAVVREALSNTARHAQAQHVDVLVAVGDELRVEVTDDGMGIGTPERSSGLANMRVRAEQHGGRLEISEPHSGGTSIRWMVPIR
jgi:signal transduction histidine kinase